jgi:hypothetical protein
MKLSEFRASYLDMCKTRCANCAHERMHHSDDEERCLHSSNGKEGTCCTCPGFTTPEEAEFRSKKEAAYYRSLLEGEADYLLFCTYRPQRANA